MKFLTIIFIATCFQVVSARGYSQITLSETNTPLQKVFQKIQAQSGYDFVCTYETLKEAGNISVDVRNVSLQKALEECLKAKPLTYVVIGKTVVVQLKEKDNHNGINNGVALITQQAPPTEIHGRVVNRQGDPVSNVSVLVAGTKIGTTTNSDGQFKLTAPDNSDVVLEFSSVGYQTKKVNVGKQNTVNVVLELEVSGLSDVVVVGYGSQLKKDITGSVAVVDMNALKSIPSTTVEQQLQGQAAGVTIISSGAPGGESNIFIRGISSFGNSDPLVIVDGVQGSLHDLNPNDIASIQVLKDAGSAAIYGVRGSNGVILVTTKKGRPGSPKVSYDANFSYMVPPKGNVLNLASPADLAAFIYKVQPTTQLFPGGVLPDYMYAGPGVRGIGNAGDSAVDPSKYVFNPSDPSKDYLIQKVSKGPLGTDWFHQLFKPAFTQKQTLSVTGGSENANYLFSFDYLNQNGTLIETSLKRYSVRINTSFKIGDKIRLGENAYLFSKQNPVIVNQNDVNAISWAYLADPIIPVHDIKGNYGGTWAGPELGPYYNPVAQMENTSNNINNTWQTFGNMYAEVDFLRHFTARTSFGGTINNGYSLAFFPVRYQDLEQHNNPNSLNESSSYNTNWVWTNTVVFNQTFGKQNVKALGGIEAVHNYGRSVGGSATNFFSSDPNSLVLSNGTSNITNFSNASIDNLYSLFGRIDYSFEDKYLLAATIRRDGSSRFGPERKYGVFPSVSLGWRISNESFMKEIKWLNDLKLRGSWGKLGSQNNVQTTNAFNLYNSNFGYSYYGISGNGSTQQGFYQSAIGNPNTGWEEDIITNIGLDATLLNNMFNISVDWYKKSTNGLLFPQPLPAITGGATPPTINIGDIQNTGLDLSLTYHGGQNNDFKYNIGANLTTYKNLVVKIPDPGYFDVGYVRNEVGHPVSSFFGYEAIGFFADSADVSKSPKQQDAAPGRFKYKDVNGDGQITPDDRTFFGNPNPKFTYGVNLSANYKNFDFSMILYGSHGNQVYNEVESEYSHLGTPGGLSNDLVLDSWTPQNLHPKAQIAEALTSSFSDGVGSSFYVENGSFLKCRSLMVGFTLKPEALKRLKINNFRIYAQASNLFTITKYSGLDPELQGSSEAFGIDVANYPNNFKNYVLGVNVSFQP